MNSNTRATSVATGTGLAVFAVALAYFFSSGEPWSLHGENKISLFPMTQDAWRQWTSGRFPAWTGGMWAGFPLFAGGQSAALYLPHAVPFAVTPPPHWRAFDISLAMHAGWLAAGFMLLLQRLGARPVAALMGTLLLLQAPHVVWWTNFLPCFVAFSWWPWLLLASERLCATDRLPLSALLLGAVAIAAQVFVGYVEFAFYSGCIAGVWILTRHSSLGPGWRLMRVLLLSSSAAALAAPQFLPVLLDSASTIRGLAVTDLVLGLQKAEWTSVFDPFESNPGRGFGSVYLGVGVLALATAGLLARVSRAYFLAGLAVVAGLIALGPATPVHGAFAALPGFSLFRTPSKFFVITELAVLTLAALGFDRLLSGNRARAALGWALAALAGVEYALHFALHLAVVASPHVAQEQAVPEGMAATEHFRPLLTALEDPDGPPPRVLVVAPPGSVGSLVELYGIEALLGSPPALLSGSQAKLLNTRFPRAFTEPGWLALTGVRYVVLARACAQAEAPGLVAVDEFDGQCLLRNLAATPRFTLLAEVLIADDEAVEGEIVARDPGGPIPVVPPSGGRALAATRATLTPTGSTLTATGSTHPAALGAPLEPGDRVASRRYAPGHVVLDISTSRERFLFVREARNPGWRARIDGEPAAIWKAGGLFFAVPVPAGRHAVELSYRVRGLDAGLGAAAAWILGVAVFARIRRA